MILQLLISRLVIDVWCSSSCFHLICWSLIIHFLKRILIEVNRWSVSLWRNLGVRQLSLLLENTAHLLGGHQLFDTLRLSYCQFFQLPVLVVVRVVVPVS